MVESTKWDYSSNLVLLHISFLILVGKSFEVKYSLILSESESDSESESEWDWD